MRKKTLNNYYRRYDEYYTRYEHVKEIFEDYIPKKEIEGKIVYCPCDSEESNFVKYLKDHKDDLGYKELIYTSDDYNDHQDLFDYCDIVVTNPPFSKLVREFIPILNRCKKKFFILGSLVTLYNYYFQLKDNNVKFQSPVKYFDFIIPEDCNLSNNVGYVYIYNLDDVPVYRSRTIGLEPKEPVKAYEVEDGKKILFDRFKRIKNIDLNFEGKYYCPVTILLEHNRRYVDICGASHSLGDFETGKILYVQVYCRNKRSC